MMGWPFLHPDFLRWTVDMFFKKKKKSKLPLLVFTQVSTIRLN